MNNKINNWISKNNKVDFNNKNVFITGASSGIGLEIARHLLSFKANIYMLIRNIQKGETVKEKLLKEFPLSKIELIKLDLADFKSIRECAETVKKYDIDIFINNAGVFNLPNNQTKDGLELIMGTNYIGAQYLNDLLLPYFNYLNKQIYVLFTSSIASRICKVHLDDFFSEKHYVPLEVYCRSKICINNMYYNYLDEYKDSKLILSVIHPGATYTPLIERGFSPRKVFLKIARGFMKVFLHSPTQAALSAIYALNFDKNVTVGPRGFIEITGLPKLTKFKKNKNYKECVIKARTIIDNINNQ